MTQPPQTRSSSWRGAPRLASAAKATVAFVHEHRPSVVAALAAAACTVYLNERTKLVPKWGDWYGADPYPYVILQLRSWLSGRLALLPHPDPIANDYVWGRGGMHFQWGLGLPILALPFHLVGRLFGSPGFPDDVRFLVLYALTTFVTVRAFTSAFRDEPGRLATSALAAGFVVTFPPFVGLLASRFLIYEQAIAVGALWNVLLLAGLLSLTARCTPARVAVVCGAAAFSVVVRAPLLVYAPATLLLALLIARRKGLGRSGALAGLVAFGAGISLYLLGNAIRFGSPFKPGYANCLSGVLVNRQNRWGLPYERIPFFTAAKETFATLFLMDPVSAQLINRVPPELQKYAVGERYREYYSPTFDLLTFAVTIVVVVFVLTRLRSLWKGDRPIEEELPALAGLWALPPIAVLFCFYTRFGGLVTRYFIDMYPAFAAAFLCVGMAAAARARRLRREALPSLRLALAGAGALYIGGWHGWATGLSEPVAWRAVDVALARMDARTANAPTVPDHFRCGEPYGRAVHGQLEEWYRDCTFASGMVFAMPHSPCLAFTFAPNGPQWIPQDERALSLFSVVSDGEALRRCGPPEVSGETRRLVVCEARPPPYLLDGLRLYGVATLDEKLVPMDRLKLMRIDSAPSCPANAGAR